MTEAEVDNLYKQYDEDDDKRRVRVSTAKAQRVRKDSRNPKRRR